MDSPNLLFYTSFYNTPPLWQDTYGGLEQFHLPFVDLVNFDFPAIPRNLRLGHQIEFIFQRLISNSDLYRILVHNLPVYQNKISLGEIDYILQNIDNGQLIHVELTYKLYIIRGNGTAIDRQLVGPNGRDAFIFKKERIKGHQLPLLYLPESIQALRAHGIAIGKVGQQICFKSQLFIPYDHRHMDLGPFNPDCIVGTWIFHNDFDSKPFKSYSYYIPSRLEWLLAPHDAVNWKTHGEVFKEIEERIKHGNAPLVWVKGETGTFQKMFILF